MLRKLLFVLTAFVLAWFFGPLLSNIFSNILPFTAPVTGKAVEYFTNRSGDFYVHVILWTIIFIFLLPVVAFLFGFLAPHARRYSTTKFSRRIQGIASEWVFLGSVFVSLTMLFGILTNAQRHEAHRLTRITLKNPSEMSYGITSDKLKDIDLTAIEAKYNERISTNRASLTNYLDYLASHSLRIGRECYDINRDFTTGLSHAIDVENSRQEQEAQRPQTDTERILQSPGYKPILGRSERPGIGRVRLSIDEYLNIRSNHTQLVEDRKFQINVISKLKQGYSPEGSVYESVLEKSKITIRNLGFWRRYILLPAKELWFPTLLVSLFLLVLLHVFFKAEVSGIHRVFMRFIEEGRFGQGGSGRFAGLFEEWGLLSGYQEPSAVVAYLSKKPLGRRLSQWLARKQGTSDVMGRQELFMGRSLYNPFLNIGLSDDRHMLTIAPSRTGKGATAIIPNLLLWQGSAIIIDPKGTNAAVTAKRRREMGQKVHLVDPFGVVEKNEELRACFNPLENLNPNSDTIREDIGVIADALVVPDPAATDNKHWDDGARTVLSGLIGQLVSDTAFEKPSLPMIRQLLALYGDKQDELWATMYLNPGAGDTPRDAASRIMRGAGTNEISGLISNADKHSEWLSSPTMRKTLSKSTFSFADLKEQPTTIYLILPPRELANHNRFLRLFINMAILQMAIGGRSKIPVLMILDEFLALGYMAEVEKALGLMAGYNLVLWPIIQDLARLKDLYKNSVNSFIANSRAVQIFGISDPETTEYVSKQLGNSASSVLPTGKFSTFVPLRSPDEVSKDVERDSNRQYILRAGKAPLVLEKVAYYDSGLFRGRIPGLFDGKYDTDPDHPNAVS